VKILHIRRGRYRIVDDREGGTTQYFPSIKSRANTFGSEDQVQLAKVYRKLADKGCRVLLSNSDTPFIRRLYSDFNIKEVDVQRAINCKGSKRAGHKELLIYNYS
jgi:site-specific DNA-adenine methylase